MGTKSKLELSELYPIDGECLRFMRAHHGRWREIYRGTPPWAPEGRTHGWKGMGAAKMLCGYLAGLNTAECEIEVGRRDGPADRFVRETLRDNAFFYNLARYSELCEAMGGAVLKPYNNGRRLVIDFVDASCFYPISWDNRRILEGVFVSRMGRGDREYVRLEAHTMAAEGGEPCVVIENRLFEGGRGGTFGREVPLETLPELGALAPRAVFLREKPLFSYLYPASANNLSLGVPLGISRFAGAEETLRAVDAAFLEWQLDRAASRKRILAPAEWFRRRVSDDGEVETRWDEDTTVYQKLNYRAVEDQTPSVFAPSFEVERHLADLQGLLDLLCAQTGLSNGSLAFDGETGGGVKTATEVRSQNSRTFQTVAQNQRILGEAVGDLVETLLYLGRHPDFGMLPPGEQEISVRFDDSVTPDRESYISEGVSLAGRGLLSKHTFFTQYLQMTAEEAKAELRRLREEETVDAGGAVKG